MPKPTAFHTLKEALVSFLEAPEEGASDDQRARADSYYRPIPRPGNLIERLLFNQYAFASTPVPRDLFCLADEVALRDEVCRLRAATTVYAPSYTMHFGEMDGEAVAERFAQEMIPLTRRLKRAQRGTGKSAAQVVGRNEVICNVKEHLDGLAGGSTQINENARTRLGCTLDADTALCSRLHPPLNRPLSDPELAQALTAYRRLLAAWIVRSLVPDLLDGSAWQTDLFHLWDLAIWDEGYEEDFSLLVQQMYDHYDANDNNVSAERYSSRVFQAYDAYHRADRVRSGLVDNDPRARASLEYLLQGPAWEASLDEWLALFPAGQPADVDAFCQKYASDYPHLSSAQLRHYAAPLLRAARAKADLMWYVLVGAALGTEHYDDEEAAATRAAQPSALDPAASGKDPRVLARGSGATVLTPQPHAFARKGDGVLRLSEGKASPIGVVIVGRGDGAESWATRAANSLNDELEALLTSDVDAQGVKKLLVGLADPLTNPRDPLLRALAAQCVPALAELDWDGLCVAAPSGPRQLTAGGKDAIRLLVKSCCDKTRRLSTAFLAMRPTVSREALAIYVNARGELVLDKGVSHNGSASFVRRLSQGAYEYHVVGDADQQDNLARQLVDEGIPESLVFRTQGTFVLRRGDDVWVAERAWITVG